MPTQNETDGITTERFRLLIQEITDYAMILMDMQGRIIHWNPGAERILGYREPDVLGLPISVIFTPDDRAAGVPQAELEYADRDGRTPDVRWLQKKDGSRFWADGVMFSLHTDSGQLCGFGKVIRDATESQKTLDQARQRMAIILESITDAFFALDREWKFTYLNDQAERLLGRTRDTLLGKMIWEEFPDSVGSDFYREYHRALSENSAVKFETYSDSLQTWREVRAYPSAEGLSVYFHDISDRKSAEQAQAALLEYQRSIATQLQSALQPEIPAAVPGMTLAKHLEASLSEASVGGDFFDVFPLEDGCTALIVGDLSGKGLAAAAQVATVRNMARYALFRSRTLASAVMNLNELLIAHGLLTGYSTLFIGKYDSGAGLLKYVNCGQEPAMIWHAASGEVEALGPTGPVLGVLEDAVYSEESSLLDTGDALAIFTDGLTEIGPSHLKMLGNAGVAALLKQSSCIPQADGFPLSADSLVERLMDGVNAFGQDGARDDMCLLVGIVTGQMQED